MAGFLIYLTNTGMIHRTGTCPDGMEAAQAQAGETVLLNPAEGVASDTHYVLLGPPPAITAKAAMPTTINKTFVNATGSDVATVSNVPPGASAYVDWLLVNGNIADGSVEFTADTLGFYVLRLEHLRYLPIEYRIGAGVIEAPQIVETVRILPTCCTPSPIRDSVAILPLS